MVTWSNILLKMREDRFTVNNSQDKTKVDFVHKILSLRDIKKKVNFTRHLLLRQDMVCVIYEYQWFFPVFWTTTPSFAIGKISNVLSQIGKIGLYNIFSLNLNMININNKAFSVLN